MIIIWEHGSNYKRVTEGGLRIFYTRSPRNKTDIPRGEACVYNCDIILITDKWIDTDNGKLILEFERSGY